MKISDSNDGTRGVSTSGSSAQQGGNPTGRSWFFGIGINRYADFPSLNNAVKDIQDVIQLLQERYDLESDYSITLFNKEATRENIINNFDRLKKEVQPEDKLLIYYSGHGHLEVSGESQKGFWIPTDAQKDHTAKYIRNSTIKDFMEIINSLHTLLICDSCFSGSLFISRSTDALAVEELERRKSRWAICSGRHDEEVFDGEPGENSPFTASILEVLRLNQAPKLNVARVAVEVVDLTRNNYKQLPLGNPLYGIGHKNGEYIFQLKEDVIWAQCQKEASADAFQQYLALFPEGKFTAEAKMWLSELEDSISVGTEGRNAVFIPKLEKNDADQGRLFVKKWYWRAGGVALLILILFVGWKWLGNFGEPQAVIGTVDIEGQTYQTFALDELIWLADNLNYPIEDSWCNGDAPNCEKYGRLYTWAAARKACEDLGWRLPSGKEWRALGKAYGGIDADTDDAGRTAYAALIDGGTSWFDAMLGGSRDADGEFHPPGNDGYYWTNTQNSDSEAQYYHFFGQDGELYQVDYADKRDAHSCRCVKRANRRLIDF